MKYLKVTPILLLALFLTSCDGGGGRGNYDLDDGDGMGGGDGHTTRLMSQYESGLEFHVYNIIFKTDLDNKQKNALFTAVKDALALHTRVKRDGAISDAVANNGNEVGLANSIIAQIEKDYVMPLGDSGLLELVYREIANISSRTVTEKNALIKAVADAVVQKPSTVTERTTAITAACDKIFVDPYAKNEILKQVDVSYPLLMTQPESGLPDPVYQIIVQANAGDDKQKNDIMKSVQEGINANPSSMTKRGDAIKQAVPLPAGLAEAIIQALDKEKPLLLNSTESGLEYYVYDAVSNLGGLIIVQKNAIMKAVKEAIKPDDTELERNAAVKAAVTNHGGSGAQAQTVFKAVADGYLMPREVAERKFKISRGLYDVIAQAGFISGYKKNSLFVPIGIELAKPAANRALVFLEGALVLALSGGQIGSDQQAILKLTNDIMAEVKKIP